MKSKVQTDFRPLRQATMKFLDSPAGRKTMFQCGVVYRSQIHRRFIAASRGGGQWKKLKARTARRKRSTTILRITETLVNALHPTRPGPGHIAQIKRHVITVGYGGIARHPEATKLTIEKLAEIHHRGLGRVPAREIIVDPSSATLNRCADIVNTNMQRRLDE